MGEKSENVCDLIINLCQTFIYRCEVVGWGWWREGRRGEGVGWGESYFGAGSLNLSGDLNFFILKIHWGWFSNRYIMKGVAILVFWVPSVLKRIFLIVSTINK